MFAVPAEWQKGPYSLASGLAQAASTLVAGFVNPLSLAWADRPLQLRCRSGPRYPNKDCECPQEPTATSASNWFWHGGFCRQQGFGEVEQASACWRSSERVLAANHLGPDPVVLRRHKFRRPSPGSIYSIISCDAPARALELSWASLASAVLVPPQDGQLMGSTGRLHLSPAQVFPHNSRRHGPAPAHLCCEAVVQPTSFLLCPFVFPSSLRHGCTLYHKYAHTGMMTTPRRT